MQRYYVKRPTGKVFGPFDENAIRLMLEGDKIGLDAQVSTDKQTWQPISEVSAFSSVLGNRTQMGVGQFDLPTSAQKDKGLQLPTPKSATADLPRSKGSGPQLPIPKSGGGGPQLPTPKSGGEEPALPIPKSGGGGPQLPTPKSSGIDLPRSRQDNLPRSGQDNLPRSGQDNLPRSGHDNLPRSGQGNLPRSGQSDLPRSSQDNLPEIAPPPADPPVDDDLFGSPIEDDGALFGSPDSGLAEESSDLFGSPDSGLAEESSDLFGSPDSGLAEESSDLFDSPEPAADPAGPDPLADDDDLFDAPEMDDDDLFAETPVGDDEDDFLGGDGGFSFLDDEPDDGDDDLEDWEEELGTSSFSADDFGADEDDWGDDLLDDDAVDPQSPTPESPARPPASQAPADSDAEVDNRFRPASRGIQESATTSRDETVEADKKRGSMTIVGVAVLGILLFAGGGFGIYQALLSEDDEDHVQVTETSGGPVEIHPPEIMVDNFSNLSSVINQPGTDEMDPENRGLLLVAKSLFLTRYEDQAIEDRADALAADLETHDDLPAVAVGLATHHARLADSDAARALAEPFVDDEDYAFFAHLSMGIADANAHFEGRDFEGVLGIDDGPSDEVDDGDYAMQLEDEAILAEVDDDAATDDDADDDDSDDDDELADGDDALEEADDEEVDDEVLALADRAARHLQQAADLVDTTALPHFWLGRISIHLDEVDDALAQLEDGVEASPEHVASRLQAGQLYYRRGDLNDATEHLQQIIVELANRASDDERGHALHLMGLVHQARQESEKAIELFTRALHTDSSRSDTLRALAREYENAEKYQEALTFFTTDENLAQEDPEVILGIVRSHMGLENWDNAIDELERGAEQFPNDARFSFYLGVLNEQQGNFYEAQAGFEEAISIDPDLLTARASLAQLAWRVDEDASAGDTHIRAIIERPEGITAEIAAATAEFYRMSARPSLAVAWNEEALRRDPNYWQARLALAQIHIDQEEPQAALRLLERARDEGVQALELSAHLADAYRLNEQYEHAIEEINEVISADPEDERYIFIRGLIEYDRGNYSTARDDFQQAHSLNTRFHDAYFYIGRTHLGEGEYSTAIRLFRHVLNSQPHNGEVHFYMGQAFEADGSPRQALDSYSNAIRHDPDFVQQHPDVLVRRGRILSELGRPADARNDVETALRFDPQNRAALQAMGILNFDARNYREAIEQLSEVLAEYPDDPDAQFKLGMAYLYENQPRDAARHLKLAVDHGYDQPDVHRTRGYIYRDLGQRNNALDAFRSYLQHDRIGDRPAAEQREVLNAVRDLGG